MKVTGPGSGVPGAGQDAPADPAPIRERAAESPTFADKVGGAEQNAAPGAAGSLTDAVTDGIMADLQAGRLDARAAVEKLVEAVIDGQLGADAPASARDQLRAVLHDALESDPLLTEKLRQVDGG
jgi:hypothetical protein